MSKLDEKKAELEDLKTCRNYAVTSLLALIAFIFTKENGIDGVLLIISFLSVVILSKAEIRSIKQEMKFYAIGLGVLIILLQLKVFDLIGALFSLSK